MEKDDDGVDSERVVTIFNEGAGSSVAEHSLKHGSGGEFDSSPAHQITKKHRFRWNQKVYLLTGELYLQRWTLGCRFFTLRLHRFLKSDDQRAMHDHPWWFVTFVLKGGYWDLTPSTEPGVAGMEWVGPGSIRYRPLGHRHTVKLNGQPSWSIVLTGPYVYRWGFYVPRKGGRTKFYNSQRYFRKFGHH